MAAFQQRRQATTRPTAIYSPSSTDNLTHSLALSSSDHEDFVLLLSPQSPQSTHPESSWQFLPTATSRAYRTTSFTSTGSATSSGASTGQSGGTSNSLDSPSSLRQAALLPAHDGTGSFYPVEVGAASLVQAEEDESTSLPSPSLASTSSSRPFSSSVSPNRERQRRPSAQSQLSFGSSFERGTESEWGRLTEENLGRRRVSKVSRGRNGTRDNTRYMVHSEVAQSEEERQSAGFTSESEFEDEEQSGACTGRPGRSTDARPSGDLRTSLARQEQEDADWTLSPSLLSSGLLLPRSSSRRRVPPSSLSQTSSILHSFSSSRSAHSSGGSNSAGRYKRRHRRAGGRGGSASSQKKTTSGGASEEARREEVERQERMKKLVRDREEERSEKERVEKVEEKMLFGHAVLSYFHIPPSSLALIASAPSSTLPTPTTSRPTSPSRRHGLDRFAAQSAHEASFTRGGSFTAVADEEEVSDAETEHPATGGDGARGKWRTFGFAPRSAPATPAISTTPRAHEQPLAHRSKSTPDIAGLDLTLRLSSRRKRRSSLSTYLQSASRTTVHESTSSTPVCRPTPPSPLPAPQAPRLSHEERILLAPPPPPSSSTDAQTAWGGEFETFELAMSYWRRLLRTIGVMGPTLPSEEAEDAENMSEREVEAGGQGGVERNDRTLPVVGVYA
ncbi:hypothetical protein JCM11641_000831 [Rhodosporidiobolus odoratus]